MSAAEIARALGGARREGRHWRCNCPIHGGNSLTLRDGRNGLLVKCWGAGCDARDILAALRRFRLIGGDRLSNKAFQNDHPQDVDDRGRRIGLARRIWDAARDARASPVVRYLTSRRITLPLPPSLRWAPACPHPSGVHLPAMVARVENVDGDLIAIHRTFLRPDGSRKADIKPAKAMLGSPAGGAVRLAPGAETLMVGEGVETSLAATQACCMPTWAALSTSGIAALRLPPIVRNVIILADKDTNGAGEWAARTAARRWLAEGRRVRIAIPPEPGTDFADVLLGRAHVRIAEARDAAA